MALEQDNTKFLGLFRILFINIFQSFKGTF